MFELQISIWVLINENNKAIDVSKIVRNAFRKYINYKEEYTYS
jgi:DNA-binding protein